MDLLKDMTDDTSDSGLANPHAGRLGYVLRRASAEIMSELGHALEAIGLRPVEASILTVIGANPGCIQSDIGRMLGIQRANMAPLISGLVRRDLIVKSKIDGRTQGLALTPLGGEKAREAEAAMSRNETQIRTLFGDALSDALLDALQDFQLSAN